MSTDTKSAPAKQKLTLADLDKITYVGLYDERGRVWGFFTPEEAAMLKTRTEAEWYALACKLLVDHPTPPGKLVVIPYEEAGKVRGRFFITPWSDKPATPPKFTQQQLDEFVAMSKDESQMLSEQEFREAVFQDLQADDPEYGAR